jgi:hypothetical protein
MTESLITLVLPPGAQDGKISHGTVEYLPYRQDHQNPNSAWLVDVAPDAARYFCWNGGFRRLTGR